MTVTAPSPSGSSEAGSAPSAVRTQVVLDTSVLVADPTVLFAHPDADVVVPLTVIEELDGLKRYEDDRGRSAREALRTIESIRAGGDPTSPIDLPDGGSLRIELNGVHTDALRAHGLDPAKADNRIIGAALGQVDRVAELDPGRAPDVVLVSNDAGLRIKAAALGVAAREQQTRGSTEQHRRGWEVVDMASVLVDILHNDRFIDNEVLAAHGLDQVPLNEFVAIRQGGMARRDADGLRQVIPKSGWDLKPRGAEQTFALDLLMDPDIPIVALTGPAGTGKTILALGSALEQVVEPRSDDHHYDRIMILRPIYAVERQEIGFLPGTVEEKMGPWMDSVVDAYMALHEDMAYAEAKDMLADFADRGQLTMEPLTFLRGRSLRNTLVLIDEAQNAEIPTLKTILTRIGEGSKAVFLGDETQMDNPYVSQHSNALSVLVERFSGQPLFGHIRLEKGQRSPVADLAARTL